MEHLSTFGLSRDPFANEPDLTLHFAAPSHVDAERRLVRGVEQAKGLCVLTGAGGSGKTLLVRRLLERIDEERFDVCAMVPAAGVSDGVWLLDRLARQLGADVSSVTPAGLLGPIYERLAAIREEGRHAVLLVDEAQILADQGILPTLRGLLNLEYEDRRLLSLLLVGTPALDRALASEPALADRVELRVKLGLLDEAASIDYLAHRMRCAGGDPAAFEPGAQAALVKLGGGLPRRINNLADGALFEAHLLGRARVEAEDVLRAAAELDLVADPAGPALPAASRAGAEESEPPEVFAADTDPPVPTGAAGRGGDVSEARHAAWGLEDTAEDLAVGQHEDASESEIEDLFADLVDDASPR